MKSSKAFAVPLLGLGLFAILTRSFFWEFDDSSFEAVSFLHSSAIGFPLFVFFKAVNYVSLYGLVLVFLGHTIFVHPNWPNTLANITFFCISMALNSLLKLAFGEMRPFIRNLLGPNLKVLNDCETDFGMPSGHLWFAVTLYQLYKVSFFEKMPEEGRPRQPDAPLEFQDRQMQSLESSMSFSLFNRLSFGYLFLLGVGRWGAGSHTVLQILVSLTLSLSLTNIFVAHHFRPLRSYFREMLVWPERKKASSFFALRVHAGLLGCISVLFVARTVLEDTAQQALLHERLFPVCGNCLVQQQKNLVEGMILFLPVFMIALLHSTRMSSRFNNYQRKQLHYFDLTRREKVLRLMIFVCLVIIPFFGKELIEYVTLWFVPESLALLFYGLIEVIALFLVALCIVVLAPIFLFEFSVLLKNEFVYIEDLQPLPDPSQADDHAKEVIVRVGAHKNLKVFDIPSPPKPSPVIPSEPVLVKKDSFVDPSSGKNSNESDESSGRLSPDSEEGYVPLDNPEDT